MKPLDQQHAPVLVIKFFRECPNIAIPAPVSAGIARPRMPVFLDYEERGTSSPEKVFYRIAR